jgi:hypothetical protein
MGMINAQGGVWQQVEYTVRFEERVIVEILVPIEEQESTATVIQRGEQLAAGCSASIWNNPNYIVQRDVLWKKPRIINWFPDSDGRPDYEQPLLKPCTKDSS